MKHSLLFNCVGITIMLWIACTACSAIEEDFGTYSIKSASQTEIHFFHLMTCPRSNSAKSYINENYLGLKVKYIDISDDRGEALLNVARKEYKLGNYISTPLICCGDTYIQGWDVEQHQQFDDCVQRYR